MNLIAVEIPDDPPLLPGWLEEHLVGTDLAALVADSRPCMDRAGEDRDCPSIRCWMVIVTTCWPGLKALPADRLRILLCRPRLLLDLQELVLASGGAAWLERGDPAIERAQAVERGGAG